LLALLKFVEFKINKVKRQILMLSKPEFLSGRFNALVIAALQGRTDIVAYLISTSHLWMDDELSLD